MANYGYFLNTSGRFRRSRIIDSEIIDATELSLRHGDGQQNQFTIGTTDVSQNVTIYLPPISTIEDEFAMKNHPQTLTNKSLTLPRIDGIVSTEIDTDIINIPSLSGDLVVTKGEQTIQDKTIINPKISSGLFDTFGMERLRIEGDNTYKSGLHLIPSENQMLITTRDISGTGQNIGLEFQTVNGGNIMFNASNGQGTISMGESRVINVDDPTSDFDAVNKRYVHSLISGLDIKESVLVATTEPLSEVTYTYDASGSTTSASDEGMFTYSGILTIDGVGVSRLTAGSRILVKDQTDAKQNGIYVIQSHSNEEGFQAVRADDFRTDTVTGQLNASASAFTYVETGSTNGQRSYVLQTQDPIVLNQSDLTFFTFTSVGNIIGGKGIDKDQSNVLNLSVDASHFEFVNLDGGSEDINKSLRISDSYQNLITRTGSLSRHHLQVTRVSLTYVNRVTPLVIPYTANPVIDLFHYDDNDYFLKSTLEPMNLDTPDVIGSDNIDDSNEGIIRYIVFSGFNDRAYDPDTELRGIDLRLNRYDDVAAFYSGAGVGNPDGNVGLTDLEPPSGSQFHSQLRFTHPGQTVSLLWLNGHWFVLNSGAQVLTGIV